MRHRVSGKKLGRDSDHRKALRRNLTIALFEHGRIKTTRQKADFVRGNAERLITIAKRGYRRMEASGDQADLVHAQRVAASRLYNNRDLVKKLFDDIAPHFEDRDGGYTRILKLGPRKGDQAEMVFLELVDYQDIGEED
ncbi:MAG: 50S ribosomal protein L17 [Chloroflexota bacterium]